jgi:hypothetical protein
MVDLVGQGRDERALRARGRRLGAWGAVLGAEVLDAPPQVGVAVEEGMGDAGFAPDGLEGDRLAALDQPADRLFGCVGLRLGLDLGSGGQRGDAALARVGHDGVLR